MVLGRHNLTDSNGVRYNIRGELPHPEYKTLENDFMLVFLEGTPTPNNVLDPSVPNVGQDMTTTKWDDRVPQYDFEVLTDVLLNIGMEFCSNEECGGICVGEIP